MHGGEHQLIFVCLPTALGRIVGHHGDGFDARGSTSSATTGGPDKSVHRYTSDETQRLNRPILPGRLRGGSAQRLVERGPPTVVPSRPATVRQSPLGIREQQEAERITCERRR